MNSIEKINYVEFGFYWTEISLVISTDLEPRANLNVAPINSNQILIFGGESHVKGKRVKILKTRNFNVQGSFIEIESLPSVETVPGHFTCTRVKEGVVIFADDTSGSISKFDLN